MLDQITPIILTLNEEMNIGRCLKRLRWAHIVVVVDSGSTDKTEAICDQYKNVCFFTQPFENHALQWSAAVENPLVKTEWVLTLDADYIMDDEFERELDSLEPSIGTSAYESEFIYWINGHPLSQCVYPSRIVLARKSNLSFYLDGHTQRQKVAGQIEKLHRKLQHDDRKSESHWQLSQAKYARLEAIKLTNSIATDLPFSSIARKYFAFSPYLVRVYLGLIKGMWFSGSNARIYIQQRVFFERLLQQALKSARKPRNKPI
jgi:glycosyltransferase involved in cell wall biosynthesis